MEADCPLNLGCRRALTDHIEYYRQGRVAQTQVRALYFNDQYPARTDPGLVGSDDHPLKVVAHPDTAEYEAEPPPYLFGKGTGGSDGEWAGAVVVRTELALQGERVATAGGPEVGRRPKAKKRKLSAVLSSPKKQSCLHDHKHLVSRTACVSLA